MIHFLLWYFTLSILGVITFPIVYRLLPFLADKGYSFSRIAGLLIWSYIFWILTSLGVLSNNINGAILGFLGVFLLALLSLRQNHWSGIKQWLRKELKSILIIELLFLCAFCFWTIVRAANPDILGTEKPMELAFINSISRSPAFPPSDPWLSGYAVSYYYFGYVMVALLGYATGTPPVVSFNLALAAWFALSALGCYGVAYNLLKTWQDRQLRGGNKKNSKKQSFIYSSLLGPFFVLIVSNAEGFLEMLHAKGLFWQMGQDGLFHSSFWSWLNIQELNQSPSTPFSFIPERVGGIWWWRASRVLEDFDILGHSREIIDEFPFFSYLLGDLHPHVLAMPFGLMAIGLALNLFRGIESEYKRRSIFQWLKNPLFWFTIVTCGGIAFINTWDLPVFLGIIVFTYLILRIKQDGWKFKRILEIAAIGLVLGVGSVLLYLPFFLSFSSQAGGILPSLNFFTRGINFWVMFFPFLLIIIIFLTWLWQNNKGSISNRKGFLIGGALIAFLSIISYGIAWLIGNSTEIVLMIQRIFGKNILSLITSINSLENTFLAVHGGVPINEVILTSINNRLVSPFTMITLSIILIYALGFLVNIISKTKNLPMVKNKINSEYFGYFPIILLIFMGAFLCIIPEFLYLRDVFGTRMNTIFKFYFQTWTIWGIASASITVILWNEFKKIWRFLFRLVIVVVIMICVAYPIFGLKDKFGNIKQADWTLDGSEFVRRYDQDEFMAIEWLRNADYGNVAEAIGGSYSGYARVSTFSGLPSALGWPGHEMQWRGGLTEIGNRESDIQLLFETHEWMSANEIINKYAIKYVFIGGLERSKYEIDEVKFQNNLIKVFSNNSIAIYRSILN
jgi:YYY domain-containing protein